MILILGAAFAAPGHLRAVAAQPADLGDLEGPREVRVYWDLVPARLEVDLGSGWELVAEDAEPGLSIGRVPPETRVRVDGVEVSPTWGLDASGVARLVAPGALPGSQVADIWPPEAGAWVALLGGGLVRVHQNHLVAESFGVAEGLPTNEVNAVREHQGTTWVGTGLGLARLDGSQVLDDTLPDPWVQALGAEGETLWIGTWHGLARMRHGTLETVLSPRSVFSIEPGSDARLWAGYDGLRGLPEGEPIEGVDGDVNVWDVEHEGVRSYLATDSEGILLLQEGLLVPFWGPGAVYALARVGEELYAAADTDGLLRWTDGVERIRAGVPGDAVYEVVPGPPGKLWVGTDDGLALAWPEVGAVVPWPVSAAAEGRPAYDVLAVGDAVLLGGQQLALIGELGRRHRDAAALPGPVYGLEALGGAIWVLTGTDAFRVDRRLHRVDLPETPRHVAVSASSLWVAGDTGLYRYDAGADRFVPIPGLGQVDDLDGGPSVLLAATGGRVVAIDPAGMTRDYVRVGQPRCIASAEEGIWIGTATGLQLLDPSSGEVVEIPGFEGGVADLAVGEGATYALLEEGRVVRVPTEVDILGSPELWTLGALHGLRVDERGRIWVLGERGYALLLDV